jgi:eukaryotic-like serine/threonine-protein kinase
VLAPDDRFAAYVIDEAVGHGGSATVYRAHHVSEPNRAVALKVLDDRHRQTAQFDRIRREFDFAGRLRHPHVVTVYECGTAWLAMELVDGGLVTNLDTMTDRLTALAQIADALDHAHRRGIVHCDVKPSNVLVRQDFSSGGGVLIDFGVAHSLAQDAHHRPTHVEASLPYAAPELLRGRAPSAASDEYALACTAVELLTGRVPYAPTTTMDLIDAHLNRPVPRFAGRVAGMTHAFDSVLAKAMAKDPDHRYTACAELIRMMTRALG